MEIAGGNGTREIPTARNETGAIDTAGFRAGSGVAKFTFCPVGYIARLFPFCDFFEKRLGRVEATPLIGHAFRGHSRLPPAALCQSPVRRVHHDPFRIRPVSDVPGFGHPLHLSVAISSGNRLVTGDTGGTRT